MDYMGLAALQRRRLLAAQGAEAGVPTGHELYKRATLFLDTSRQDIERISASNSEILSQPTWQGLLLAFSDGIDSDASTKDSFKGNQEEEDRYLSEDSDDEEAASGGGGGGGGRSSRAGGIGSRNRRGRRSRGGGDGTEDEGGPEARRRRRQAKREPHHLRRDMPLLIKRWAGSERLKRLAVAEDELVDALNGLLLIRLGEQAEVSEAASAEGQGPLDVEPGLGAAEGQQRTEGEAEGGEQRGGSGAGDGEREGGEELWELAEELLAGMARTGAEAGRQEQVAAPPAAAGELGVDEPHAAGGGAGPGWEGVSCAGVCDAREEAGGWTGTVSQQPNGHLPSHEAARSKEGWQPVCVEGADGGSDAAGEGPGVAAPAEDVEGVEGLGAVTLEEVEARVAAARVEHSEALAAVQWALEDVGRMLLRVVRVADMYRSPFVMPKLSAVSGGGSSSSSSSAQQEGLTGTEDGSLDGSDDDEDVMDAQFKEALRMVGGDQGSDPRDSGGPGDAGGGGGGGMSDSRRRRRAAVRAINAKNPRVLALLGWVVLGAFQGVGVREAFGRRRMAMLASLLQDSVISAIGLLKENLREALFQVEEVAGRASGHGRHGPGHTAAAAAAAAGAGDHDEGAGGGGGGREADRMEVTAMVEELVVYEAFGSVRTRVKGDLEVQLKMCGLVSGLRKAQHRTLLPTRRLLHEQRAYKVWSRVRAVEAARAEAETAAVRGTDEHRAGLAVVNGSAATGGQGGGVRAAGKGKKKKKKGGAGAAAGGAAAEKQQAEGNGEEEVDGREADDEGQGKGRSKGAVQQQLLLLQQGLEEDEEQGPGRNPYRQEQMHGEQGWEVQEQGQDQQLAGAFASSPFNPMPHAASEAPPDAAGVLQLPPPAPEGLVGGMGAWLQLARLSLCWDAARRRFAQLRAINRELGGGRMFTVYMPGQDWTKIEKQVRVEAEAERLTEVMAQLDGAALSQLKPLCRALAANVVHWDAIKALVKSTVPKCSAEDVYDTYDISQWDDVRRYKFARMYGKEDFWGAMPITAGVAEDSLFGVTDGTAAGELERLVVGVQPDLHGRELAEYEERLRVRVLKESEEGERRAWDGDDVIKLHHRVQQRLPFVVYGGGSLALLLVQIDAAFRQVMTWLPYAVRPPPLGKYLPCVGPAVQHPAPMDPYAARPAALLLLPLGPVAHSVVQYPGSEVKASNHSTFEGLLSAVAPVFQRYHKATIVCKSPEEVELAGLVLARMSEEQARALEQREVCCWAKLGGRGRAELASLAHEGPNGCCNAVSTWGLQLTVAEMVSVRGPRMVLHKDCRPKDV